MKTTTIIAAVLLASAIQAEEAVRLWENGPKWATKNIGAEKPEDAGYYFWWGDTVGCKRVGDCWQTSDGSCADFRFTASNCLTNSKDLDALESEGWIKDGVLEPEHDAARVLLGEEWRLPTANEISELRFNCSWSKETRDGVVGFVVRGKDKFANASIFLPAAGFAVDNATFNARADAYYWSSTPHSCKTHLHRHSSDDYSETILAKSCGNHSSHSCSCYLYNNVGYDYTYFFHAYCGRRYYGMPIRAVRE